MQIGMFNSVNAAGFPSDWTSETVLVIFGGGTLDLTERRPAPGATLTIAGAFGGVKIIVPAGTRLAVGGLTLFGGRDVRVRPGEGPDLSIRAFWLFGDVSVVEGRPGRPGTEPAAGEAEGTPFP